MAAANINAEQFQQLIQGQKPVLVDFWAPWCGYCRRIGPVCDRLAGEYADQLVVVKVNTDDHPKLASSEQIEVVPTLVLYRGGTAMGSIVAPESRSMIRNFIHNTLNMSL